MFKKVIEKIKFFIWQIQYKIRDINTYFYNKRLTKLYPDYKDDEYNCGTTKFIWGVKSWDDLSGKDVNFYTMNDIDISYDRKDKIYLLGIETAYIFKDKNAECEYLKQLLNAFTNYMDINNLSKENDFMLFMNDTTINNTAKSIEELYINFKIFVEGFCKTYNN